eukprot:450216-Pelagomonas_calceolata.AAC.2
MDCREGGHRTLMLRPTEVHLRFHTRSLGERHKIAVLDVETLQPLKVIPEPVAQDGLTGIRILRMVFNEGVGSNSTPSLSLQTQVQNIKAGRELVCNPADSLGNEAVIQTQASVVRHDHMHAGSPGKPLRT